MEQILKIILPVLSWCVGVFLIFLGLGALMSEGSGFAGLAFFVGSGFVLPPVRNVFHKITNRRLPILLRVGVVSMLFIVAIISIEPRQATYDHPSIAEGQRDRFIPEKAVKENKKEASLSYEMPGSVSEAKKIANNSASFNPYKLLGNLSFATDLQKKEIKKDAKGKFVQWIGRVDNVKEKIFGGYKVDVLIGDGILSLKATFDTDRKTALSLSLADSIFFVGTIRDVDTLWSTSVQLEDVRLVKLADLRE